jgi:predicted acyl esterase
VLVYDTEPLTEDMEIVGPITARLFAATSAHDTDWMIRLARDYRWLYAQHVLQAHEGCDFGFLRRSSDVAASPA